MLWVFCVPVLMAGDERLFRNVDRDGKLSLGGGDFLAGTHLEIKFFILTKIDHQ